MSREKAARQVLAFGVVVAVAIGLSLWVDWRAPLGRVLDFAQSSPWGPWVFMGVYVLACVLFVPASFLTVGAGAAFGFGWGLLYVSFAATAGAIAAFVVGRYLARDWVIARVGRDARFSAIDRAVFREGWKIVLLLRLSPFFPFNFLNYALGLSGVRLREYAWATWLGILPGTALYTYIGVLAGEAASLKNGVPDLAAWRWFFYAVGLAATVGVAVYAARLARRALSEKLAAPR